MRARGLLTNLKIAIFCWIFAISCQGEELTAQTNKIAPSILPSRFSDQLTQATVTKIHQDTSGYLWLATQSGLNRYDGASVTQFRKNPRQNSGFESSWIIDICSFPDGQIWVGTLGGGVAMLDQASESIINLPLTSLDEQQRFVTEIACLQNSETVIAGTANGLVYFDKSKMMLIPQANAILRGREITELTVNEAETVAYIGTEDGHLFLLQIDEGTVNEIPIALDDTSLIGIRDSDATLIVATEGGTVNKYDLSNGIVETSAAASFQAESGTTIIDILIMEDKILLGTNQGIVALDEQLNPLYSLDQFNSALTNDQINSLYRDRSGVVWIGSLHGVMKAIDVYFRNVQFNGQTVTNSINSLMDSNEGVWIASDGGVHLYDKKFNLLDNLNTSTTPALPSNNVMSLFYTTGAIWIATRDSGLMRLSLADGQATYFDEKQPYEQNIAANGVTSIVQDQQGKLWIGTFGGGLQIVDANLAPPKVITSSMEEMLPQDNVVLDILIDKFKQVWIATLSNGLWRISADRESLAYFNPDNSELSTRTPWVLKQSPIGDLYIGSPDAGLSVIPVDELQNNTPLFMYPQALGSLDNKNIYSMEFLDNLLWVSHDRGLTAIDLETDDITEFDTMHGLTNAEFNHKASYKSEHIGVVFGGNNGLTLVDKNLLSTRKFAPPISFKKIEIHGTDSTELINFTNQKTIELDHSQRSLTVEIALLDFLDDKKNLFRYRLAGFDQQWTLSQPGRSALASYSNLTAGSYTLEVESIPQNYVNRTSSKSSLNFVIAPSPWATPTAYSIYVVLFLFGIWVLILRSRHVRAVAKKRRQELEKMVLERTKELKEAQDQAVTANNAKSEFLATISHELRTPMHGILGLTESLIRQSESENQILVLNKIRTSGEALVKLINQILDFAKIESNRLELDRNNISIITLLQDVGDLFHEVFLEKGIGLYIAISDLEGSVFEADELKVKQCLINLVGNSLKFTSSGYVLINCELRQDRLTISVKDTGTGIAEEHRSHIFEPFRQADSSTSRTYAGTGLGLSIVSSYIELMKGHLDLESTLGKGTCVSFSIPVSLSNSHEDFKVLNGYEIQVSTNDPIEYFSVTATARSLGAKILGSTPETTSLEHFPKVVIKSSIAPDKSATILIQERYAQQNESGIRATLKHPGPAYLVNTIRNSKDQPRPLEKPERAPTTRYEKVLIVDDVETNRFLLKIQLETIAGEILEAENGENAVSLYHRHRPEFILMDCQMPIMDGYKAAAAIREFESKLGLRHSKIIALTASALESDHEKCIDSGMDATLTKPFNVDQLYNLIEASSDRPRYSHTENKNSDEDVTIDFAMLKSIKKVTGDGFKSLVDLYVREAELTIQDLSRCNRSDLREISRLGHKLKSSSLSIGLIACADICKEIEHTPESLTAETLTKLENYVIRFKNKVIDVT